MPLYEFKCHDCGIFDAWRSLAESNHPANCPTCEQPAKRIFSPPTALLSGSLRLKTENPEPQLVKRDREPKSPKVKNHNGGRPWMIGH
ncbi:FmdB family zinc ribbon protein [Merismopedia glauca]|uniref:Zinc ribbon domain-containing protein n=1 Tax=Merismopedia glauca CCAP 1448/3 TaxID=1296344 RepID=A0A2T1BX44_9CYAN|nr:zinc ribbon domain-containing protein [Merismopedia glauca]PSB00580.1 zinc ribbon domain-containing protein [Merismopedia glauca CCAP 1448/3]